MVPPSPVHLSLVCPASGNLSFQHIFSKPLELGDVQDKDDSTTHLNFDRRREVHLPWLHHRR